MKYTAITRLFAVLLLAAMPYTAYAVPDFSGLGEIVAIFLLVVIAVSVVSIVAAVRYFRRGGVIAFWVALISGLILYMAFGFVRSAGVSSPVSFFSLIPLLPLGLLCYRPIRRKSTIVLPYAGMNIVVSSAASIVVTTFAVMADLYHRIEMLSQVCSTLSSSWFVFLLVRALQESDSELPPGKAFLKGNLVVLLNFVISMGSYLLYMGFRYGLNTRFLWINDLFLQWFIPMLIAANLVVWLTLRFFRKEPAEDVTDLPL